MDTPYIETVFTPISPVTLQSTQRKLAILADAAKYDASCASSGTAKRNSLGGKGIGSTEGSGICHSYAPDGRCISLLKILLTNFCTYDCLYCVNRVSSNVQRARFTVEEVVNLTLDFYRRNCIEGLFLSSGIIQSPDYTMEQVVEVARSLRHDALDADHLFAQHLAQAVRRDMHKMKAFVRFRTLEDEAFKTRPLDGPLHVAWFEPEHHIVEAITPFFARRFTQMRWAILTPERCVAWDGASVTFSPGARKDDAPPPDAGEQLWLTYYQHIFNPARLKLKMMQKEMPRRYWHNLPEAQFISTLSADAARRQSHMLAQTPATPRRRLPVFKPTGEAATRLQTTPPTSSLAASESLLIK